MNEKIKEVQEFLHASLEELNERDEAKIAARINKKVFEQSQRNAMENIAIEGEYKPYHYTPENAHERKAPKLIDTTPREDEEVFKLPKAKVSEIEGNIEREDKERGVVLTRVFNKKTGSYFRRLYDVSGAKPVLLVSGDIFYKNGMFIVNYPNKQKVDDRGDYLKYMQSALYKLNKNNRPDFVAANVLSILDNGWFEKSSGVDYSVYLCKDADKGYKRIMRFSADMSGHREVSSDGRIVNKLDRSDFYRKDVYQYDAENNTLRYVEGEGYVPDRDDEEEYDDEDYLESGPNVNIEILENSDSDSYTIYFYDSHDDKGHSLASLTVWNLYQADKKYWNVSEDGQVTISDYDKGVVRVIGPSRDEHGKLSVSERAMDINERKAGYDRNDWKYMELDCGTFLSHPSCSISQGGIFINKDGSENDIFEDGRGVEILENGLGSAFQDGSDFV